MNQLSGKVAIVTGADSGIGQATAVEFAREGADVVVCFHSDEDGARRTCGDVEALGRAAVLVQADVGEERDVDAIFAEASAAFGRVDIVVNNAGVDDTGTHVADLELDAFLATIRVNLAGPMLMARAFIRQFRHHGATSGGRIINVTSVHEEIPRAGGAAYDASKGGLRNLTRTLALEVAAEGITVNNLAPGMVLTPMNQEAVDDPAVLREQTSHIPVRRAAQPTEIGRLAVYLASDDAAYVTGASYVIDGGLTQMLGQGA